jgi:hypothetical protein
MDKYIDFVSFSTFRSSNKPLYSTVDTYLNISKWLIICHIGRINLLLGEIGLSYFTFDLYLR